MVGVGEGLTSASNCGILQRLKEVSHKIFFTTLLGVGGCRVYVSTRLGLPNSRFLANATHSDTQKVIVGFLITWRFHFETVGMKQHQKEQRVKKNLIPVL